MQIVKEFPKNSRIFRGTIDEHFLQTLLHIYTAAYKPPIEKAVMLTSAITELDLVKFLLSIAWESKMLANEKYIQLSEQLDEIGRMLGGWKKGLDTKNSHQK